MIIKHGDLFDTDLYAIGHGVNVDGLMGAGIAKDFKAIWPFNYKVYKNACETKTLLPGGYLLVADRGNLIVNMASQDRPGRAATYSWLSRSVHSSVQHLKRLGITSMAIPQIGCGIGGLEWTSAEKRLRLIEKAAGFEFEVWIYE